MRILGLTVGRNEQFRYLRPMLAHMHKVLDGHYFYDDLSDDETPSIAASMGCTVVQRSIGTPSFAEDEAAVRGDAWVGFEREMHPEYGDWVLVIDCDEVLVATAGHPEVTERFGIGKTTHEWLRYVTSEHSPPPQGMRDRGIVAIDLLVPEVWGFYTEGDGRPLTRHDGLWGTIHAPRLFQYRAGGAYAGSGYGVPAVPNYAMYGPWASTTELALMHYGYAEEKDQFEKYWRYSGRSGHSNAHVESIVDHSNSWQFRTWDGPHVKEMNPAWNQSTS